MAFHNIQEPAVREAFEFISKQIHEVHTSAFTSEGRLAKLENQVTQILDITKKNQNSIDELIRRSRLPA